MEEQTMIILSMLFGLGILAYMIFYSWASLNWRSSYYVKKFGRSQ